MSIDLAYDVLLVEDNEDDRVAIAEWLEGRAPFRIRLEWAVTLAEAIDKLVGREFDAAFLDLTLPDSRGIDTVSRLVEAAPKLPVIVLTALDDRATGLEAIRAGAQDYLAKRWLSGHLLARVLEHAIERHRVYAELERKTEMLRGFAAMASHDIRGPLRNVRQLSEIVTEDALDLPAETRHFLQVIQAQATNVSDLVHRIHQLAELGARAPEYGEWPLRIAIEEAIESIGDRARDAVRWSDLPTVWADRVLVTLVFRNLIENAVKYVHEGTVPSVQISARVTPKRAHIEVRDNGIGVPEEERRRVFEPLQRGRDVANPGSGMGLALCRAVIESHGEAIALRRADGGGSVVTFALPRR